MPTYADVTVSSALSVASETELRMDSSASEMSVTMPFSIPRDGTTL